MKTVIICMLLLLSAACGSGGTTNTTNKDSTISSMPEKGNSGGSDVTGLDTARMDTSMQNAPAKH